MYQIHDYTKRLQGWGNNVYQFPVVIIGRQGNSNLMLAAAHHVRRFKKGDCHMALLLASSEGLTISLGPTFT